MNLKNLLLHPTVLNRFFGYRAGDHRIVRSSKTKDQRIKLVCATRLRAIDETRGQTARLWIQGDRKVNNQRMERVRCYTPSSPTRVVTIARGEPC